MPSFISPRPMQIPSRKPRNPLVAPAQQRQAGRHTNPRDAHAQRLQSRQRLHRLLSSAPPDDSP